MFSKIWLPWRRSITETVQKKRDYFYLKISSCDYKALYNQVLAMYKVCFFSFFNNWKINITKYLQKVKNHKNKIITKNLKKIYI